MLSSLISTKFQIPPLSSLRVERPRLLEKLEAGFRNGKLILLICAPAGYGKTCLASEWVSWSSIDQRADRPGPKPCLPHKRVAWLTCESEDGDLARFLSYLVASLQQVDQRIGKGVMASLHAAKLPTPVALGTLLINDLTDLSERFVLVLDDFHTIHSQSVQEFISFLVEHPTPKMCLLLVTRADPALPLTRLRARGQMEEIRQEELAFSSQESADFISRTMKLTITPDQVAVLEKRTEGWAAGLQLAALSLQTMGDIPAFIEAFSGGVEYIADYLADEVLAHLPDEMCNFLLQTSILDRLSGPLCAAVTENAKAAEILEVLKEKNLFLIPQDYYKEWYRYHTLFGDLLRNRLVQAQAGQIDQLHLRASRWYQEKGFVIPAIDHALRGQAYDQAALLLEKVIEVIFINGQLATLQPWLEMLPENIKDQHSILWIFHCLVLLWSGKSPAGILPFPPEREARITQDGFTGEIHTVEALYAMLGTKTVEAESLARKALQEISLDCSLFRCIAADTLGMVRTIQSDIPGAMRAFEELVEIARRGNFTVFEISGLSHLAGLYLQLGRLGSAEIGYQQALELCNQKIGKFSPGRGNALLGLGEIAREKHNLELALQYFEETINLFTQLNETSLPIAYLSVARVKAAQGDWQAGQAYLDKARQTRRSPGMAHYYERLIDNLQARFWIVQGDLESAEQWANRRGLIAYPGDGKLESAGSISAGSEFVYADFLAVVYLNLAQHQPEAALEMIESLLSNASQMGFLRREIQLLALKAIAQDQKNDGGSAIQTLQSSLMLAESEGYQQVFLDGGEPLKKLLYRANTRGQASSYARRILKLFPQEGSPLETPVRKNLREDHYLETLSAREMEVLALIAEGLSNHEICSRLHISLSTVKGHTANIYGKLGVNSRTQAILEASHLGILPD